MGSEIIVGIDIGGTFTDLIGFDKKKRKILGVIKVPSTPRNPADGLLHCLKRAKEKWGNNIVQIIHGTTIATNALLGQVGLELPKTALITTKGFKDVLEIGRQKRPELYNLFFKKPKPLIPRNLRFEVDERLNHEGKVIRPLNIDNVRYVSQLLKKERVHSVAVSLLHSYLNPVHEKKISEILKDEIDDVEISLSSEVDPEYREFERTSTTVVNAVLIPIVKSYMSRIIDGLKKLNIDASLLIMQSNGGVSGVQFVSRYPYTIIESGPAAGIIATKYIGNLLKIGNLIGFDMGGTTAKAGTIINGVELKTNEFEVGGKVHSGRIIKGSGYPVRFSFVEISEISAGGGSIIWVDEGGALKVGPLSAGADPGPAAYNKGGLDPTLTDANIILGRLNSEFLLGGEMKIYKVLAVKAFHDKIQSKIGLDPEEAAIGALKIANDAMSKILRIVTVEKGVDPRDFIMVAYGGAGPMHMCALMDDLNIRKGLIPRSPGIFSSLGLIVTDVKHSYLKSVRMNLSDVDPSLVENIYSELEEKGMKTLKSEGFELSNIVIHRLADLKYWAQGYELTVESYKPFDEKSLVNVRTNFEDKHRSIYGYILEDEDVELVNLRVEAIGLRRFPEIDKIEKRSKGGIEDALIGKRRVYFEKNDDFEPTPVYAREKLLYGDEIMGPAIIEEYDSTVVIYPDYVARIDEYGIIHIEKS